jgi:hypothetical protein
MAREELSDSTQRFTWRVHVEDREEESRTLDLTGDAKDLADLRHDLTRVVTHAITHLDEHADAVADDEDGWELRAAPFPSPAATDRRPGPGG